MGRLIVDSRFRTIAAVVTVTVVTVAVIGVVLLATTPLGCGPAKALRVKLSSTHCLTVAQTLVSPSPSPVFPSHDASSPQPSPTDSTYPPTPAASQNPFPAPASDNQNPYPGTASAGFPAFSNPASGASPAGLALNCRLPIYAGGPGSGGFIVFPNGTFIADPRSAVTAPSPSPGPTPAPPQYGYGYQGWWGTTYDRAYSKWLPVPYTWVTPDGTRYAYPGQPDGIYVQNITNGTQLELGEGKFWQILDVEANGVYAVTGQTGGLWLLTFAGAVTQVTSNGFWQAVRGGYAYGTATSSVPQGVGNTILRLNLSTGASVDYFSYPSVQSSVAGFDYAGKPVIYVQGQNLFLVYLGSTQPGQSMVIANLFGSNFWPNGAPVGDSHGLWLASGNGIALYVAGVGWYSMSGLGGQLAGGCL